MSYDRTEFPSAAFDRWLTTPPDETCSCGDEECEGYHDDEEPSEPEEFWPEFEEPEDRYLDASFEDRYYIQEPDFDIY